MRIRHYWWGVVVAALLATLGCGAAGRPVRSAETAAAAGFTIRPYLQAPGRNAMTIAWTSAAPAEFTLKYGEGQALDHELVVKPLPEPIDYLPRPDPRLKDLSPDAPRPEIEKLREHQYLARLTGLRPDQGYRYEVSGAGAKAAGEFRTFPDRAGQFSFIACGDSQGPDVIRTASAGFMQWQPRFIVHVGDLINNGPLYQDWADCFFTPFGGVPGLVPVMPARGNHDGGEFFPRLFGHPEGRLYYSFDYGNAHFVALRSGSHGAQDEAMLKWCDADLAASKADWKIVYYHHPSYDAGANEPDCWGRGDFVPVFRKHGVDLVMGGHTHAYQRFRPMFTKGENEAHPITFLVIGGMGGGVMRVSQDPYLAAARSADHYLVVSIAGKKLSARAVAPDGGQIDAFEIRKDADGRLDRDYLAQAVPEDGYGRLRALVAPCLQGLSLSDDLRAGRPATVKLDLGAGDQAMKFTLQLERRAAREYEMTPVSGETPAGGTQPVEVAIRLRNPARYADPKVGMSVLRLECVFEIGRKQASVFSNRLAYKPPEPPDAPGAPDAGKKDEDKEK